MPSRLILRPLLILACVTLSGSAWAVQPSELLLPATTKGYLSTNDVEEVRKKFNETQLGALLHDPVMEPFIEDLKKQVREKLERAGKRLGLKWEDLEGVYGGEVAVALVQPDPKDKQSHATVLIVDITGKRKEADALLAKIDANQKAGGATRGSVTAGGVQMTVYAQPRKEGEEAAAKAYYFIRDDQLVVTDHLETAKGIAGRFGGNAKDALAGVQAFSHAIKRNNEAAAGTGQQLRWFVEPFGYTEAARAAQGVKRKRGTNILKIVQNQGFSAVQGIGGYIFFAAQDTEILHRTYVYAPTPYNLAMRMLDFPNSAAAGDLEPQAWALSDVASYLTFNWKMSQAFEYSETLVDAIIGEEGVFDEIWLGLKTDPNQAKIDIYKELVDHLGTRATLMSDVRLPVGLKSERLMALIEVKSPEIVAKTVEKAFKNDPQAKKRIFRGETIWEITQDEGLTEEPELVIEGVGFVSAPEEQAPEQGQEQADDQGEQKAKPQPGGDGKLPNMAITVLHGHLVVSTHVDFIEDLITGQPTNLGMMEDCQRVRKALTGLGSGQDSFRFFSRTDESYRASYELIKQGRLPEAETMLAYLLNSMLGPKEEGVIRKQEIDGSKLPDFDQVKKYLGPGGVHVQTEDQGWWIVGCLLKKQ